MIDFLRRYKYYLIVPTALLLLAICVLMWMSRSGDDAVPFIYQISGIGFSGLVRLHSNDGELG